MNRRLSLFIPLISFLLGGCAGGINKVTGITLDQEEIEVEVSCSTTLTATIEPKRATNQIISWESLDPAIAIVSNGGVVTGVSEGKTTVKVTTEDGGHHAECEVNVIPYVPVYTHATNIVLSHSSIKFDTSTYISQEVEYTIFPEDAHEQDVVITSSNNEIASVEKVEGENKFIITAGAGTGKAAVKVALAEEVEGAEISAFIAIEVVHPKAVTGVRLDKKVITLDADQLESTTLLATVEPSDAANKEVDFTSSDNSVATYKDGRVMAVGIGEATITVKTRDGGFTDTCLVNVVHTPSKRVYIDFEQIDFSTHAYLDAYSVSREGGTGWPGLPLDKNNILHKEDIILSGRNTLNRDFYYWDVLASYDKAIFTNSDGTDIWHRWNDFDLTTYNLFKANEWGVSGDDYATVRGYESYNVYKITLLDHNGSTKVEYNIPQWSHSGYSAPKNDDGYMWAYEDGLPFANGSTIYSDLVLHEVEIPVGEQRRVDFYHEGSLYETVLVKVGSSAAPSKGNPYKADEGGKQFKFDKWVDSVTKEDMSDALANVQSDLVVESTFKTSYKTGRYILGAFGGGNWDIEHAIYMPTVPDKDPTEYSAAITLAKNDELKIAYYNGTSFESYFGYEVLIPTCGAYTSFVEGESTNIKCNVAGSYTFYFTDGNWDSVYKMSVERN